jgi:hypothetical protein
MKVFTDEWKQQISERYKHLREHKKPFIYFVATNDHFQQMRLEIEESFAALHPSAQNIVITKLRSPKNFTHTYHELVAGKLLRHLGYTAEYEVDIGGLTPDWYAHARGDIPAFVLEVFTANVSNKRAAELRAVKNLWGWLQEIPVVGVALYIEINQIEVKCDDKRGKELARTVQNWLNTKPPVNSRLDYDDFSFEVFHYNPSYTSLQLAGPGSSFMVNKEPVRINFKEKIHKYRKVLAEKNFPLVVGVVADFMTGVSFDSFLDLLFGSEAINYSCNELTEEVRGSRLTRLSDGLFHREPALSAAAWVEKGLSGEWQIKCIHNPQAILPLPISAFTSINTDDA